MLLACLLFAVLPLTVYGELVMARALAHATESVGVPGKLHYLFMMFPDIGVLTVFGAAVLAGVCWMLAIERLEVRYAYLFVHGAQLRVGAAGPDGAVRRASAGCPIAWPHSHHRRRQH
jgi:hypothetical protein